PSCSWTTCPTLPDDGPDQWSGDPFHAVGVMSRRARGSGRWLVEVVEFGADGVGVGVVELVEDGQGLLPRSTGGGGVAGSMVGVTEVGESVGFLVAVAEVPKQVEGVLIAGEGMGV